MINQSNENYDPVSVVVNVYNEVGTIESEIRRFYKIIVKRIPGSELIVAEDGSTDGTKDIIYRLIDELGIIHSTSDERKGYKKALKDAFDLAKSPYIFFSDTGNKHDPHDFWKLYPIRNDYDFVVGVKTNRKDQIYRRILTLFYNKLLSWYFNVDINDADSGFRFYQKNVVEKVFNEKWLNKDLIASEITLRAIYSGFKIKEIPISYQKRIGKSRGLPLKKIPGAIFGVLSNFAKLRSILVDNNYSFDQSKISNELSCY